MALTSLSLSCGMSSLTGVLGGAAADVIMGTGGMCDVVRGVGVAGDHCSASEFRTDAVTSAASGFPDLVREGDA